jgi:hypothetical protein
MLVSIMEPVESPQDSTSAADIGLKERLRRHAIPACLALGLLLAACSCSGSRAGNPLVYTGTTCTELAREWGHEVDGRISAIIDGPDVVDGLTKSAQNTDALVQASTALSVHMDHIGILDECDMPEFLPIAEREFSDKVRAEAGSILYDSDPVATYDDWYANMQTILRVIDDGDAS